MSELLCFCKANVKHLCLKVSIAKTKREYRLMSVLSFCFKPARGSGSGSPNVSEVILGYLQKKAAEAAFF